MRYRRFGRTGWEVSELGYGMWGMGGWSGSDDEESLRSLQRAVDLGVNFFDTAYVYGEGHSEGLLGQLVRANPDKRLYTASKVPPKNRKWPSLRESTLEETFPPDYVEEYVHLSLKNLGLERVDLMQFHVWEDAWARRRALGEEVGRAALARAGRRRRHQHQPLGALERRARRADGAHRRRAGHLQHLRPEPGGRAVPRLSGARRGRHRARPLRRGHADGHAHEREHAGPRATGATRTSSPRTSSPASSAPTRSSPSPSARG